MTKRPPVIPLFYKHAHNYRRDYNVKVQTLGHQIEGWWSEICSGATPSVRFGGPTGIYTVIVLMSWWCTLLKDEPIEQQADCLRTLAHIDCVLLTAINEIKAHLTTSTSLSSTKRKNSEDVAPKKRKRVV